MNIAQEEKKKAFKEYGKSEFDSGSTEAQVALFTKMIQHLTEHLKESEKEASATERSLVMMVGRRRNCWITFKTKDIERYRMIIKKLKIRK